MNTQEIWSQFHQDLLKFIHRRVSSTDDAQDILQDVFRKIHDAISNLTDESKIQSWVYQITRNTITDYYRARAKRNGAETPLVAEQDLPSGEEAEKNLNQLVSSWLRCIVEGLDDKYKEAIMSTEFGNLTQKELAEKLGISLSGAKSRVQRGREKIKEALLDCCHFEMDRFGNVIDYQKKTSSCGCKRCDS